MNEGDRAAYLVFYDASCELCRRIRGLLERLGADRPMRFIDVNDRQTLSNWPQIDPDRAKHEVFVLDPGGQLVGGYDAAVALMAATVPALRFSLPLLRTRFAKWIGGKAYHLVSSNRHRISRVLFRRP